MKYFVTNDFTLLQLTHIAGYEILASWIYIE